MPQGPEGNLVLRDTNNYTSQTSLTIPIVETAPGADLEVCWGGIRKDLLCHDLVPATDIDNVGFLQIGNLTREQVSTKLAVGQLQENLVRVYRERNTAADAPATCTKLSRFVLGGATLNPAEDYVDPARVYMLLFATGTTSGVGARSMMFLEPKAGSTTTMVQAPDACASDVLEFNATIGQPVSVPASDSTKWDVDWSSITRDSFGNKVPFGSLKRVLLGFYQGWTMQDLMTRFLDIEVAATSIYEVDVMAGERHVDLANAKLRGGNETFPGFTRTDGIWMVAVMCSNCQVPAPVVLTVLQPS